MYKAVHTYVCKDCGQDWACWEQDCDDNDIIARMCQNCSSTAVRELSDDEMFPYYEHGELVFPGEKRSGMKDNGVHQHICTDCDEQWTCLEEECESEHFMTWRTCEKCVPLAAKRHAEQEERPGLACHDIHTHACPRCGREWECGNECGETATEGSWTPMTCSLCTEHLMKLVGQLPVPGTESWERTETLVATSEKIVHPHTHTCVIGNHLWEHDDIECAFETIMMDPKGMKNLECPACFVFA